MNILNNPKLFWHFKFPTNQSAEKNVGFTNLKQN